MRVLGRQRLLTPAGGFGDQEARRPPEVVVRVEFKDTRWPIRRPTRR
jgi:hypothetical protein